MKVTLYAYMVAAIFAAAYWAFGIPFVDSLAQFTNPTDRSVMLAIHMVVIASPFLIVVFAHKKGDPMETEKKLFDQPLQAPAPSPPTPLPYPGTVKYPVKGLRIKKTEILEPFGDVTFKPVGEPEYTLVDDEGKEAKAEESAFEIAPEGDGT